MTEYDYSPEARQRHDAKLAGIARWRDGAHHPFTDPDYSELGPSDSLSNVGVPSPPQAYYAQPQGVVYPQPYPQQPQIYVQPQMYYPQPTYPGYPPIAQPFASPTYLSPYPSSSRKHSSKYGHHHTSGSRSHHASPSTAAMYLQSTGDLGSRYAPTVSLGSSMARSYSTPPQYVAYPAQQQPLMQPAPTVYPATAAPVLAPYGYTATNSTLSPYAPTGHRHRSSSRAHSHHSSRSPSESYSRSPSNARPVQVTAPATVVVPYGNGGHLVIPPPGARIITPESYHRPEREGHSFFGSLNPFKGSSNRLKRRSSRSSY